MWAHVPALLSWSSMYWLRCTCNRLQREMPDVEAVSSGAILSNYQRLRVENVYVSM